MCTDAERCPRVLVLKIMEDLESKIVEMRGASGWRGVGRDEGGESGGRRYDRSHGDWMLPEVV